MPQELSLKRTIVFIDRMLEGLARAWVELFDVVPKKEQILVLLSQGSLETGKYCKMNNYNIGNIKSVPNDGKDYTFYTCNEILSVKSANALVLNQKLDGGEVKITKMLPDSKCLVYFYPSHKYSRFRAYSTLEEGAIDYLDFLFKRYGKAWDAVLSGDPKVFSQTLKKLKYYTASEEEYTKAMVSLYKEFSKINIDLDNLPALSKETKEKISNSVQLSLQDLANEIIK
jgi:hypothetical protein